MKAVIILVLFSLLSVSSVQAEDSFWQFSLYQKLTGVLRSDGADSSVIQFMEVMHENHIDLYESIELINWQLKVAEKTCKDKAVSAIVIALNASRIFRFTYALDFTCNPKNHESLIQVSRF